MSRPPDNDSSPEPSLQVCESRASDRLPLSRPSLNDWPDKELGRIERQMRRVARRRVDNDHDAEDLVQETFLTMLQKYPGHELRKGLQVWGNGILRNKIGNFYKRARRESSTRNHRGRRPAPPPSQSCSESPDVPLLYSDLRLLLRRLMSDFDPAARAVMEMFFEGLKAAEIGSFMQTQPYQTLVSKLHRGRRTLGRRLSRFGYRPESLR